MKKTNVLLVLVCLCYAFSSDLQKRIIRNKKFDIECYISPKKVVYLNNKKTYFWFKTGEIHQSQANIGGSVLHDVYVKYYRSNQLAEKGIFNYGVKIGVWKSWHENGRLKSREIWKNGFLDGLYSEFDSEGLLTIEGKYRNNLKVGRWINYKTKDTTYIKNDTVYTEKPRTFIHEIFRKKDSVEKAEIKFERLTKRKNDSIKRVKTKQENFIKKRNDSINKAQKRIQKENQKKIDSINKAKGVKPERKINFINKFFKP